MRRELQSAIRREDMLGGADQTGFVSDTAQRSAVSLSCVRDNACYLQQNVLVTKEVGACSMPKVLKEEAENGVACQIQYPKIDRVFSNSHISGVEVQSDLDSGESGRGTSISGHRAPSSTCSSVFNMLEVPKRKHSSLASLWVEPKAGFLVEVKDAETCNSNSGGDKTAFPGGRLSASPQVCEGSKVKAECIRDTVEWTDQEVDSSYVKVDNSSLSQGTAGALYSMTKVSGGLSNCEVTRSVEGQTIPKLEACSLAYTALHSDCLEDMLKEGLFSRMASRIGTGKVMTNSSLVAEVEDDMSSEPVSNRFPPKTVKEANPLPSRRKRMCPEKIQGTEEVRSCVLSAGVGSTGKTAEIETATGTASKTPVTPQFSMGKTEISKVADARSFNCVIGDADPLCKDDSLKESDNLLSRCTESSGGECVTDTISRSENAQTTGVEDVPLGLSEHMRADRNEDSDGEIVAGTTRAFLEWDGEDPICAFEEETDLSPAFNEGNYMEEEERPVTQQQHGEEEGTFAQSPSGAKMVYYKMIESVYRLLGAPGSVDPSTLCRLKEHEYLGDENDPSNPHSSSELIEKSAIPKEEVKKNCNLIAETPTNTLFTPYAANVFMKRVKPNVYMNKDVPGQECLKKKIKKKKPPKVNDYSETPSQSVAQVRETCLNALVDILLKRVNECEDVIVHESSVKNVAQNVERELFTLYLCTDVHYKKKYRTLMFNLGDSKNKQLFRQVVLGEITPQFLVKMSPTELASEELKEFRESESKHIISTIEKEERNVKAWQVTKLTHKGLIEINTDMDQMLSLEDMNGGALDRNMCTETVQERVPVSLPVAVSLPVGKKTEIFDPDCYILNELKPKGLPKNNSTSRKKIDDVLRRLQIQDAEAVHASDVEINNSQNKREGPLRNLYQKPSQTTEVWTGFLKMFSLRIFGAKAFHVSGYDSSLCQALPEVIISQSCILPEAVWEYVDTIWPAESKHMGIFRFSPNNAKDSQAYAQLYTYLNSKQRYGIITSELIDSYMVPLASYQAIPAKLHPLGGPGLEECHQNLLLAVILPKRKPTDIIKMSRRPDPSRKRKVSFEYSAGRNTRPPNQHSLHLGSRSIFPSLPSPTQDSWSSPEHHQSPEPSPDFLESLINQLEEVQSEDPGAATLIEQSSTAPSVRQEGSLGGDPREALGSEIVNLLQLITQNIPLMHDSYAVAAGSSAMQPNLVGIPLVSTGHPLIYDWVSQGQEPLFRVIPSQYINMGLTPNGLISPHVYQSALLNEQCFATPVSADTLMPSEASAPQCTAESEVQSVLATLLGLTSQISLSQGLQHSGLQVEGCGSVPVAEYYIPVQQSDKPFTQPSEFSCI